MNAQSRLFLIGAVICFVLGLLLRGVETVFTLMLTLLGIVLIVLGLAFRD